MFGKKIAEKLDRAAEKAHNAGVKVAGETGGRAADGAMHAVFGGIRNLTGVDCTVPGCDHSHDR